MEDGNIREHKNYLQIEEEKRKKARVIRESVEGPLLRWISRVEKEKVEVEPPKPSPIQFPPAPVPYIPPYTYSHYSPASAASPASATAPTFSPNPPVSSAWRTSGYRSPQSSLPPSVQYPVYKFVQAPSPSVQPPMRYAVHAPEHESSHERVSQPPERELEEKEITVCKNYVVHEIDQEEGAQKPPTTRATRARP